MTKTNNCKAVTKIRVRYPETDKMGIVYHGNYLTWFEIGRTELCRGWGKAYDYWEKAGIMLPVVESYCRYKQSARYDDIVQLCCCVEEIKPYCIKFSYQALSENGNLLAQGWTKHAITDTNGKILKKEHEFYCWICEKISQQSEK